MLSEDEILQKCNEVNGLTYHQLASKLSIELPKEPKKHKGWLGIALELALGANAGTKALPDFLESGIELKSYSVNQNGLPAESIFVTSIPLLTIHTETWVTSACLAKLKRVLWIAVEGTSKIPFAYRRVGKAFLWSPSAEDFKILESDWEELISMIVTGRLEDIDASLGRYLQIRPKAANAKSLCNSLQFGSRTLTLPRGFYLRRRFMEMIHNRYALTS